MSAEIMSKVTFIQFDQNILYLLQSVFGDWNSKPAP